MTLAARSSDPGMKSANPDSFRSSLKLIGQETRFKIFCLIAENPGCLSLEEICESLGGSKERYYHQVYQLLQAGVVKVETDTEGRKIFSPAPEFVLSGREFFGNIPVNGLDSPTAPGVADLGC